jgi:hypothetical protein
MRFSLVTDRNRGNFRLTRERSLEESLSLIHDPDRLAQRLALFEALPLRCFEQQTDPDFKLVVLTSTLLPKPVKRQLRKLAESRDFLVIKTAPPDRSLSQAASLAARACIDGRRMITFRIDDDDALATDYVASLRALADRAAPGDMISFERGLYLQPEGDAFLLQDRVYRNIAIGLATLSEDGRTIFDRGSHVRSDQFPVHVDERPQAWIRLLHEGSDSGARIDPDRPVDRLSPGAVAARVPGFGRLDFVAAHAALGAFRGRG